MGKIEAHLLLSLVFLISLSSYAISSATSLEKTVPFKETICQLDTAKATLLLRFDKKIDPAENDYSGAPMVFLVGKRTRLVEPLAKPYPNDFSFTPIKAKSICSGTQGFQIGRGVMAILYSKDNRPFQDLFQVIAWDSTTDQVLDKRELGAVTDYFEIENGFAFSKMLPRSDVDRIEVTPISGRKMTAVDKDLDALQTVTLQNKKLKIEFDPTLSYERSTWKKFFKSQDDYLKLAGWDSKKKIFANIVVYEADSCIALTDKRGGKLPPSSWRCLH